MQLSKPLLQSLRDLPAPACIVDADGHLVWVNPAWDTFAVSNGAGDEWHGHRAVGRRFMDGIHGSVRPYYEALLGRAWTLRQPTGTLGLTHLCECNTQKARRVLMSRFIPLCREEERAPCSVLVTYREVVSSPMSIVAPQPLAVARFVGPAGHVRLCSSCRRAVREEPDGFVWEFVPELLARVPENTAFTLCDTCLASYYGEPKLEELPTPLEAVAH